MFCFSGFYYSDDKMFYDKINNNMNMWQESLEKFSACSLIFTKNYNNFFHYNLEYMCLV